MIPTSPLEYSVLPFWRSGGIHQLIRLGMWGEPVYDPFPYIAMHVIHTIGIWLFLAHRVGFVVGDATALPFEEQQFDVVWGQDAWCHVDDKKKLVSEAHRVLECDGAIVFSDWLLNDANSDLADELRQVTASANLGDVQGYLERLAAQGFELDVYVDTSSDVAARYRDVLVRLSAAEVEVVARFGQRIFDIVLEKQQFVLDAFTSSLLGSGSFVARKIKP